MQTAMQDGKLSTEYQISICIQEYSHHISTRLSGRLRILIEEIIHDEIKILTEICKPLFREYFFQIIGHLKSRVENDVYKWNAMKFERAPFRKNQIYNRVHDWGHIIRNTNPTYMRKFIRECCRHNRLTKRTFGTLIEVTYKFTTFASSCKSKIAITICEYSIIDLCGNIWRHHDILVDDLGTFGIHKQFIIVEKSEHLPSLFRF